MPKNAAGRNDPCPCGSGKKYKKCCLARHEAEGPKVVEPHEHAEHAECADADHLRAGVVHVPAGLTGAQAREYVERLDRWSNAASDALDEGRLEEADHLADQLRAEYPDQVDGYGLHAQVRMEQKRWAEAAEGFEQAAATALKHREDYDEEFIENLHRDAEHARAHAQGRDGNLDPSSPNPPGHRHKQ